MAWHATPLATWRAKRSKIWIFLTLNLSFFPIYLYPNTSLIKKKRTGVKRQSNWKYLRDFTWTRVTKISRISWMRHLPVNWFFTVKGNLFSFIARIPTVLRGRQYNYTETVPIGKANRHLFHLFMRTIKLSCPRQN